ncbi:uncharacterized protein METZ01_LOCUS71972, partial [marine metagenome]
YVCKLDLIYNIISVPSLMNEHKDIHPIYLRSVSLSIGTVKFQKIIYVEENFLI